MKDIKNEDEIKSSIEQFAKHHGLHGMAIVGLYDGGSFYLAHELSIPEMSKVVSVCAKASYEEIKKKAGDNDKKRAAQLAELTKDIPDEVIKQIKCLAKTLAIAKMNSSDD